MPGGGVAIDLKALEQLATDQASLKAAAVSQNLANGPDLGPAMTAHWFGANAPAPGTILIE
jgi:hypothetical protein